MKKAIVIILGAVLILPVLVFAKIGVGVGTRTIQVDESLKPGLIYTLPSVTVFNTGDEPSKYSIAIEYRENVPELRPKKEWFSFEPTEFYLEPGKAQMVQIKLSLPIKNVRPGDYFAFLSAYPIQEQEKGVTSIGIAAAAKLYFTVAPANVFQGIYYRFISLYSRYHPWDTIILAIVFVAIVLKFLGKRFKIQITKKS